MLHLLEDIDQVINIIKGFGIFWFDLKLVYHI